MNNNMQATYQFIDTPQGIAIKCLDCLHTSYNTEDVVNLYCGKCNKFHDFNREYEKSFHNTGKICPQCAEKRFLEFQKAILNRSIEPGDFVKLKFDSNEQPPNSEYMWVEIKRVSGDFYLGELQNDPVFPMDYTHGSNVIFSKDEICQLL